MMVENNKQDSAGGDGSFGREIGLNNSRDEVSGDR